MNFAILGLLGTSLVRKKPNLWWVWAMGQGARSSVRRTLAPHPRCGESPQAQGAAWGLRSWT